MSMIEVLEGVMEEIQIRYEEKDIRGVHVELVGVNPTSKDWCIGIMLEDRTDWYNVKQD